MTDMLEFLLKEQLPPRGQLVECKRSKGPVYFGFRETNQPLNVNPDASRNCWWRGVGPTACHHQWSDVTVISWCPVPDVAAKELRRLWELERLERIRCDVISEVIEASQDDLYKLRTMMEENE